MFSLLGVSVSSLSGLRPKCCSLTLGRNHMNVNNKNVKSNVILIFNPIFLFYSLCKAVINVGFPRYLPLNVCGFE